MILITMLVDAQVKQGVLQRLCYGFSMVAVLLLMSLSGLPIIVEVVLAVLFILINYWWYKAFIKAQAITEIWQQDNNVWCWRNVGSSQYKTATLQQVRYLGLAVVLDFQHRTKRYQLVIWRDQIGYAEWRKLCVLTRLKHLQQNLF